MTPNIVYALLIMLGFFAALFAGYEIVIRRRRKPAHDPFEHLGEWNECHGGKDHRNGG